MKKQIKKPKNLQEKKGQNFETKEFEVPPKTQEIPKPESKKKALQNQISQKKQKNKAISKKNKKQKNIDNEESEQLDEQTMQEILKLASAAAQVRENPNENFEIELEDDEEEDDINNYEKNKKTNANQYSKEFELKISGISYKASQKQLEQFFLQFAKDISQVKLLTTSENQSKGVAFIKVKSDESFQLLLDQNNINFMGRKLRIEDAINIKQEPDNQNFNTKSVFIGNLSFDIDEQQLAEAFSHLGKFQDCRIAKDKTTGSSKGFGYIDFFNEQQAAEALKLQGTKINGRPMKINYSFPKEFPPFEAKTNFVYQKKDEVEQENKNQFIGYKMQKITKDFEAVRTGAIIPGTFMGQKKKL